MNWGSSLVYFNDEADAANQRERATAAAGVAQDADTNVLAIKFDMLQNTANMQTGAPIRCSNTACAAVLSHLSLLVPVAADDPLHKRWECEFCGNSSVVECAEGEQPRGEDVTFLLEAAPPPVAPTAETSASAPAEVSTDDSLVVFAVDVSGSMDSGAGGPVSRLQAAKAAVIKQLDQLENEHPHRRVALLTFSDNVNVYGDCSARPRNLSGQVINDREQLMAAAKAETLPESVRDRKQAIATQVKALQTEGSTALGPGLLLAVQLAGRVPGSRVVLCTDGCANHGLGKLNMNEQSPDQGPPFYQQLGEKAKQLSVTVNVISFQGTDCRLIELGGVADATGGVVSIVDSTDLEVQLRELIENRIVASLVEATLIAHRALYWDDEFELSGAAPATQPPPPPPPPGGASAASDTAGANPAPAEPPGPKSRLHKTIGNVMAQTTLTFRFGLRANAQLAANSKLPFQAQIKYRDAMGNIALRVLSQWREQTRDGSRARNASNIRVLGTYAAQSSAAYMSRGQFNKANARLAQYRSHTTTNSGSDAAAAATIVSDLDNLQAQNAVMLCQASTSMASRSKMVPRQMQSVPASAAARAPPKSKAGGGGIGGFIKSLLPGSSSSSAHAAGLPPPPPPPPALSSMMMPMPMQMSMASGGPPHGNLTPLYEQSGSDMVDAPGAAGGGPSIADAANQEEANAIRRTIDDQSASNVYRAKKSSYI